MCEIEHLGVTVNVRGSTPLPGLSPEPASTRHRGLKRIQGLGKLHKLAASPVLPHTNEWPPSWPRGNRPLARPPWPKHRRFPTSGASRWRSGLPGREDWLRFHLAKSPLWFRPPWRLANAHRSGSSRTTRSGNVFVCVSIGSLQFAGPEQPAALRP